MRTTLQSASEIGGLNYVTATAAPGDRVTFIVDRPVAAGQQILATLDAGWLGSAATLQARNVTILVEHIYR